MEEKKKHIEIVVDPCANTVHISVENVTGKELIDGYFAIAGAIAELIVRGNEDVSRHDVIREILRRGLLECCEEGSGEEEQEGKENGSVEQRV